MTIIIHQIACQKIINGGQTGVDRGALDACPDNKFPSGGWCPKNRLAEDGKINPGYPLHETKDRNYDTRTRKNVQNSTGTLIITSGNLSGGTLLTCQTANKQNKPVMIISPAKSEFDKGIFEITNWIKENKIDILNVADPRSSEWEQGYRFSYHIVSAIILKMQTSNE